jgi:hypothetical protein
MQGNEELLFREETDIAPDNEEGAGTQCQSRGNDQQELQFEVLAPGANGIACICIFKCTFHLYGILSQ